MSIPDGVDWRAQSRTFETIALFLRSWAFRPDGWRRTRADTGNGGLGRTNIREENRPGAERVAVVSEGFWKRRLGGAPVGGSIFLSGHPTKVIGVMPSHFDLFHDEIQLWVPRRIGRWRRTPWRS